MKILQSPTIRDVALLAGVSKSLVSLVYSTPNPVSIERKERVLEAAAKLGFAPNFLARSLAANSGTFIGMLVADLHNPLFAEIVDDERVELEEKGMSLVITHLISKGHSNIAHITVGNGLVSQSRQSAYVKAMKNNGLKKFVQIVRLKTEGERESYLRTQELIKGSTAPTAITAFNDLSALGAQQAIGKADIALVGYDNTFLANLKQISLSSVDPGNKEIAKKAADLLTLKESSSLKIGKSYLSEPKLVIRRSSEKKVKRNA
jgi:DNA-binding LacI/PurR family transcriptional regulator